MLSVFTICKNKGCTESFGSDGHVYYLDCGDDVTGACIYIQTHQNAYIKYVYFYI